MRMEMQGKELFVTVCLLTLFSVTSGLRCFQCKDVHAESSNFIVKAFISAVSSDNRYCKSETVDENTPDVEVKTCPQPASGKVNKCAHILGRSHVTVGLFNVDVSLDFNARSCIQVDEREPDGCRKAKDNVQDESILSTILSLTSVAFGSYDGTTCLCSTELCNGQTVNTAGTLTLIASLVFGLIFVR